MYVREKERVNVGESAVGISVKKTAPSECYPIGGLGYQFGDRNVKR